VIKSQKSKEFYTQLHMQKVCSGLDHAVNCGA